MSRIATIVVLVVVIAFSYFAFYNHGTIILTVWQGKTMELPACAVSTWTGSMPLASPWVSG